MLRGKVLTRSTGRQGEKMFKVTFSCSHAPCALVLQLQPNQKAFLGHLPGLHSWIREHLGVTGEPGGGQYRSRTAHRHDESLALGWWGPQKELWFWGDIFCFVLLVLTPPPPHQEERRMERWHVRVQSFSWGDAEGLPQIQGQCVLRSLKTSRATWKTLSPPQRNRLHATELGLRNYCDGKWYAIYILRQCKKKDT